jgi:integrase
MRGDGRVYQRKGSSQFWIEYWHRGRQHRESGGPTEKRALATLKRRLKEIAGDKFVGLQEEKVEVSALLDALETHLETQGARAMASLRSHLRPIRLALGTVRAVDLRTADVEGYVASRIAEKKAPATINREVGALKQAFRLARKQERLTRVPHFPMLREENARQGFFEGAEVEAVTAYLSDPLADVTRFAFLSGWRRGEIVSLRWEAVDRGAREVWLWTTKNGRRRTLPLDGELWSLMERRWAAREFQAPDGTTSLSPFVFHRDGQPVVDFRKAWAAACIAAGFFRVERVDAETVEKVPTKLFHDLRRSAIRNMVRAGVPQSVAMEISGHRTAAVFMRYAITAEDQKREALRRTEAFLASQPRQESGSARVAALPTARGAL